MFTALLGRYRQAFGLVTDPAVGRFGYGNWRELFARIVVGEKDKSRAYIPDYMYRTGFPGAKTISAAATILLSVRPWLHDFFSSTVTAMTAIQARSSRLRR